MSLRFTCSARHMLVTLFALVLAGCASVPAGMPMADGKTGFLAAGQLPDSLALVPPPPQEGTAGFALDMQVSQEAQSLRGTPRWEQAKHDAVLSFPQAAETFACALAAPINLDDTPHLYRLLERSRMDAGAVTGKAKDRYQRPRPFMRNGQPVCTPADEQALRGNGSYPSGHATIGWAWALILTEVAPDRTDALLARGRAFGESRLVCNVHWNSDILEGRLLGAGIVARLQASPEFRGEVEAARAEIIAIRTRDQALANDCDIEAAALKQRLPSAL